MEKKVKETPVPVNDFEARRKAHEERMAKMREEAEKRREEMLKRHEAMRKEREQRIKERIAEREIFAKRSKVMAPLTPVAPPKPVKPGHTPPKRKKLQRRKK